MSEHVITVVGAGPAGVAAAVTAAECGARVQLIDDNTSEGGHIWRGTPSEPWLDRLRASTVQLISGTNVFDERIRAGRLILANSARELSLPFPGCTLPGVMGVRGLQDWIKTGGNVSGRRVVVAGSGPLLLAAAATAREHGASIAVVAEQAPLSRQLAFATSLWRHPVKLVEAARLRLELAGIAVFDNCWVEHADATHAHLRRGQRRWQEPYDVLAVGFGLVPNIELAALLGCRLCNGLVEVDEWQRTNIEDIYAAGELTGIGGVEKSIIEGRIAGFTAAGQPQRAYELFPAGRAWRAFAARLAGTYQLNPELLALAVRPPNVPA